MLRSESIDDASSIDWEDQTEKWLKEDKTLKELQVKASEYLNLSNVMDLKELITAGRKWYRPGRGKAVLQENCSSLNVGWVDLSFRQWLFAAFGRETGNVATADELKDEAKKWFEKTRGDGLGELKDRICDEPPERFELCFPQELRWKMLKAKHPECHGDYFQLSRAEWLYAMTHCDPRKKSCFTVANSQLDACEQVVKLLDVLFPLDACRASISEMLWRSLKKENFNYEYLELLLSE